MERNSSEVRCMYCHFYFKPEAQVIRNGKKRRMYIECPRCGNGVERAYKPYNMRRVAVRA